MNIFKTLIITILIGTTMNTFATDKTDVQEVIIKMVNAIDTKQWQTAESHFMPTVFVDYSSMNDIGGADTKAADLVGGWAGLLKTVSTHHMLTNFNIQISGNTAKAQSHVYASHLAEGIEYWDIFGRYLHDLEKTKDGWKIKSMTLIVHGQKGNVDFIADVTSRAER